MNPKHPPGPAMTLGNMRELHLAHFTRERNHGTSVSAGYFDTSTRA